MSNGEILSDNLQYRSHEHYVQALVEGTPDYRAAIEMLQASCQVGQPEPAVAVLRELGARDPYTAFDLTCELLDITYQQPEAIRRPEPLLELGQAFLAEDAARPHDERLFSLAEEMQLREVEFQHILPETAAWGQNFIQENAPRFVGELVIATARAASSIQPHQATEEYDEHTMAYTHDLKIISEFQLQEPHHYATQLGILDQEMHTEEGKKAAAYLRDQVLIEMAEHEPDPHTRLRRLRLLASTGAGEIVLTHMRQQLMRRHPELRSHPPVFGP